MPDILDRHALSLNALLLVGLIAACATGGTSADPPRGALAPASGDSTGLEHLVTSGLEVYRQHYCGTCHRLDRANAGGIFGPTHREMGTTADRRIREPEYTGVATTAEQYLRESIIDPGIYVVPGYEFTRYRMPAYTNLEEADLDALVQMLLQEK